MGPSQGDGDTAYRRHHRSAQRIGLCRGLHRPRRDRRTVQERRGFEPGLLMSVASRIKDAAAELFIGAERRGIFRKLPAFERDLREYPELDILRENYPVIRAECEQLIKSQLRIPGMEELTSYTSGGI